jgi:hypothetical protein
MPVQNWVLTISQLEIYFPGRLKIELCSDLGAYIVKGTLFSKVLAVHHSTQP